MALYTFLPSLKNKETKRRLMSAIYYSKILCIQTPFKNDHELKNN